MPFLDNGTMRPGYIVSPYEIKTKGGPAVTVYDCPGCGSVVRLSRSHTHVKVCPGRLEEDVKSKAKAEKKLYTFDEVLEKVGLTRADLLTTSLTAELDFNSTDYRTGYSNGYNLGRANLAAVLNRPDLFGAAAYGTLQTLLGRAGIEI